MLIQKEERSTDEKKRGFSGSTLKIIAIVTMLIDHIGAAVIEKGFLQPYSYFSQQQLEELFLTNRQIAVLFQADMVFRMIGRIAFPIFCFLLIEGFLHTHDIKKYAFRLLAFCFISEIPFDLAFFRIFDNGHQNVFFTLFFGLLALILARELEKKGVWGILGEIIGVFFAAFLAEVFHTDYGAFGVVFIFILYCLRNQKIWRIIAGCIAISWEMTAALAFIPIYFYNGTRGLRLKYIFYIFYPAHLLILYFIRILIC